MEDNYMYGEVAQAAPAQTGPDYYVKLEILRTVLGVRGPAAKIEDVLREVQLIERAIFN